MFNILPDDLGDPAHQHINLRTVVKTHLLPISTFSALGVFQVMRCINVRYLLTYYR